MCIRDRYYTNSCDLNWYTTAGGSSVIMDFLALCHMHVSRIILWQFPPIPVTVLGYINFTIHACEGMYRLYLTLHVYVYARTVKIEQSF